MDVVEVDTRPPSLNRGDLFFGMWLGYFLGSDFDYVRASLVAFSVFVLICLTEVVTLKLINLWLRRR